MSRHNRPRCRRCNCRAEQHYNIRRSNGVRRAVEAPKGDRNYCGPCVVEHIEWLEAQARSPRKRHAGDGIYEVAFKGCEYIIERANKNEWHLFTEDRQEYVNQYDTLKGAVHAVTRIEQ